jgi:hypothetical protein
LEPTNERQYTSFRKSSFLRWVCCHFLYLQHILTFTLKSVGTTSDFCCQFGIPSWKFSVARTVVDLQCAYKHTFIRFCLSYLHIWHILICWFKRGIASGLISMWTAVLVIRFRLVTWLQRWWLFLSNDIVTAPTDWKRCMHFVFKVITFCDIISYEHGRAVGFCLTRRTLFGDYRLFALVRCIQRYGPSIEPDFFKLLVWNMAIKTWFDRSKILLWDFLALFSCLNEIVPVWLGEIFSGSAGRVFFVVISTKNILNCIAYFILCFDSWIRGWILGGVLIHSIAPIYIYLNGIRKHFT